ncbi:MAG: type II toxin-antitoxin system PemK/MazF family toxin [Pyrinomonadaceae bacterium]
MTQGDVCYYTFKSPDKRRPVLTLTRSSAISELTWITIAPITTTIRNLPTEVWLDEGMNEICAINLDNIQTVQKEKLGKIITHLSEEKMQEVFEAIRFAFGFDK